MGYTVEADENLRAVVVRHENPMGDSYLQSRDDLIELIQRTGYRHALVVIDGPGFGTDAFRIHDHITYMAVRLPNGVRIAVVLEPSEGDRESTGFAEVVGSNRGLTLKVFEKEEPALKWLGRVVAKVQEDRADL